VRYRFGQCVLDEEARELRRKGERIHLSGKAFELLALLLQRRPNAVRKQEIHDRLWPTTFVSETNLPSLVKEVRAAIDDDARKPVYVRTAFGHGYAFSGDASAEAPAPRPIESIAVLPFSSSSPDGEDFVADGLTETLINTLSRTEGLRVVPRSTVFRYRNRTDDAASLGNELKVQAVVSGRLRRRGDRVNLQLELVDPASHSQIWGDQLEFDDSDLLSVLERLADGIRRHLLPRMPRSGSPPLEHSLPESGQSSSKRAAYRHYVKGLYFWNRRTRSGMEKAIECFRNAIDVDPAFAEAYVGLADAWITIGSRDILPPREAFPLAKAAAAAALAIDDRLAEAHVSRAAILDVFDWEPVEAENEFRRAIALDTSCATAHHWYALFLARRGRFEEALREIDRAVEMDPLAEQSVIIHVNTALIHYLQGRYAKAVEAATTALELEPDAEEGSVILAIAELQLGRVEEAAQRLGRIAERSDAPAHVLASYAHACALAGRRKEAREILSRLRKRATGQHVSSALIALVELGLGRIEEAIAGFESAIDERSGWIVYLPREPRLVRLRSIARFEALLGRIGPP